MQVDCDCPGRQRSLPDDIRRSPRFDFTREYKVSFRQMVQAVNE